MSKPRPDSPWNNLTPEQTEKLEGWLFEEGLTYRETLERAQKEFGVSASIPSLAGWYHRVNGERRAKSVSEAVEWYNYHADNESQGPKLEETVMRLVTIKAYELAKEGPEKFKGMELCRLVKLMLMKREQATREKRAQMESLRVVRYRR